MEEMQLLEEGVAIVLPVVDETGAVVDISAASSLTIYLKGPDKIVDTYTAVLTTDGTDGLMQYVTATGDIDQTGIWEAQGEVVLSGFTHPTVVSKFKVLRNIGGC